MSQDRFIPKHDDSNLWNAYKRRLFLAIGIVVALIVLGNAVATALDILLLFFLCALIAVGLRGVSDGVAAHTPLSERWALVLVVIASLVLIIGTGILVGPRLAQQLSQLVETLPQSLNQIEDQLRQYSWGQQIVDQIPSFTEIPGRLIQNSSFFARITGIFSSVLAFVSSLLIVIFISLYLAFDPKVYTTNLLHLVPLSYRDRVHGTLSRVNDTLKMWLLTRIGSMIFISIATSIGLVLLGMPLVLSLTIIAAIGAFIPTFGPILALIPAVLVALLQSPQQALFVAVIYTSIQMVDNYLVTPVIAKRMMVLPPAYIVGAQLILGALMGPLGLVLAAPIAAALVVIVRMLYVEDVLGDQVGKQVG